MTNKQFTISISLKESSIDHNDVQTWIDARVKNKWTKKEYKTKVDYMFYDMDDAFNFKMRWSFA